MGVGHRTSHVVATAAKHPVEPLPTWFAPETAYRAVLFGLVGTAGGFIYRRAVAGHRYVEMGSLVEDDSNCVLLEATMTKAQRVRRKKNRAIKQPSGSVEGTERSARWRFCRRLLVVLACGACAWVVWALLPERTPPVCVGKVIRAFPHDASASTQGLVFDGGFLYEGTGQYGQSALRKVELETGKTLLSQRLDGRLFGEGITVWNDQIVQLTWRSGVGIIYEKSTFREIRRFRYYGEGWGLTHDGTHLIMSDGSSTLRFLDPQTYRVVRRIFVRSEGRRLGNVNELEYVDGEIFANIWHQDSIARISPTNGEVTGWIDLRHLLPGQTDREACLNGIAYDAKEKRLFVTGKNWPKLFEIRLLPP